MQFNLRTIFLVMLLLGILFGCSRFLEVSWFAPARNGMETQAKFNQLIADNKWNGFVAPTHYLQNVRILIKHVDETDLKDDPKLSSGDLKRVGLHKIVRLSTEKFRNRGTLEFMIEFVPTRMLSQSPEVPRVQ